MTAQRPLGWWVKRLDQLLEEVVGSAVSGDGLTRRHWQALHSLGADGVDEPELRDALSPFGGQVDLAVTDLLDRGWVSRTPAGRLERTADGSAAHERISGRITRLRRQVTDGLTAEEYRRTVATLERMVANVEQALTGPADRRS